MGQIVIPAEAVNSGGTYDDRSTRAVPVEDEWYNWFQGRKPNWMVDDYAEYVVVDEKSPSLMMRGAVRERIDLQTTQTNVRKYHDWKGYDEIVPVTTTKIYINNINIGSYTGHSGDLLKHLIGVDQYIQKVRNALPIGWFTQQSITELVGREITYDNMSGVVEYFILEQGCVVVHVPNWSRIKGDEYYDDDRIKTTIWDPKLNWYGKQRNREY